MLAIAGGIILAVVLFKPICYLLSLTLDLTAQFFSASKRFILLVFSVLKIFGLYLFTIRVFIFNLFLVLFSSLLCVGLIISPIIL